MTTMNSNEREQRLKQIRERLAKNELETYAPDEWWSDMHFLLSLLDSQALRPTGWQAAQVAFDNSRMVKVVFETPECAEAFIDSTEPAVGPIVAATQMRNQCVAKVREMRDEWQKYEMHAREDPYRNVLFYKFQAANEIITALESLTLDVEQKEAK